MTASEEFLDHCDLPAATTQFVTKYGPPATTGQAPGGKTVLEYFLRFKENDYHVRVFLGCSEGKTERFAIVECVAERNRFMSRGRVIRLRGQPVEDVTVAEDARWVVRGDRGLTFAATMTMARMTSFKPGHSPPQVTMAALTLEESK